MDALVNIGFFAILAGLGLIFGTFIERRHYRSIEERERAFEYLPTTSVRDCFAPDEVESSSLVWGECVIAMDYFKLVHASLLSLCGGQLSPCESLLDRARREATLRMKEQSVGFDLIVNTRVECTPIGKEGPGAAKSVDVCVYGTAIKFRDPSSTGGS
jgi:uncharacterized protein YbjQ (UPF0145 family)